jgi:hypothetical protein
MRRAVVLGVLGVLSGCATTSGGVAPTAPPDAGVAAGRGEAEQRAAVEALFEREAGPSPTQQVTVGELALSLESSTPVEVRREDAAEATVLLLGLGGAQPVRCTVFDHPLDPGGTLFKTMEGLKARVQVAPRRPLDIALVEKAPAVFLDLLYLVQRDGQALRGEYQLMLYASDTAPLLCDHDEPGYAQAFRRVASGVAAALARARPGPPRDAFRYVDLLSIQGRPVGFVRALWLKLKGGGTRTITSTTLMAPRTASDWLANDEVSVIEAARDGGVLEKRQLHVSNGTTELDLTLTRVRRGVYAYRGTSQGKALSGQLSTADRKDVPGDPLQARLMAEFAASKRKSLRLEDYLPGATPVAFTPVVTTHGAGPRQVTIEAGPMTLQATLDAAGLTERASLPMGPVTMEQRRAFTEGKAW